MRKVDETIMQLSIVSNPHITDKDERDKLINELLDQRRFMRGEEERPAEMDVEAFEKFRNAMQKSSKMIKAK